MQHRTTVVELIVEPTDLFEVTQNWAQISKFSPYEKGENQTIYFKKILLVKAWLAVEHNGEKGKLEAWMSGPGVGPDFEGSTWAGWKTALPQGFSYGPPSVYKKEFRNLLSLLSTKSTSMVRHETGKQANQPQPNLNKLTKGLAVLGVIYLLLGAFSLLSAASLFLRSSFLSLANTMLLDGVSDIFFGALLFFSSKALSKGKVMGIWLYIGAVLIDSIYGIATGHNLNYFLIGFALLFIWQMFKWKNSWNLS